MSEARVAGGVGRLSTDLAASLTPSRRDALNHPLRREILRVLHNSERAAGASDILGRLSPFSRAEIAYHLQILQRCECVASRGTRPGPAGREHLYESTIGEVAGVADVLLATQALDREHRRARAGRHSSRLLTMFRIPRPTRSLRLGTSSRAGAPQ
jgi:DNA-binding transcriptional ArsR family regulator